MDRCVLSTSTPSCIVSPRGDHLGCALGIAWHGNATHSGVDVKNTHLSMINPLNTYQNDSDLIFSQFSDDVVPKN